jgi:hypothetical protein
VSFTAEFSLWFTLLCLLLAAAGSWFLYRNNSLDFSGKYQKITHWTLFSIRFVSLFIVSFLLLGPLMKIWMRHTEKPSIVLAIDGSQSIIATKDSSFYLTRFTNAVQQLQTNLAVDYDVQTYTLGSKPYKGFNGVFSEQQTNISAVIDDIKNNYDKQNLGAIIIASDGIYNQGNNPIYAAKDLRTAIYTIALGDTIQQKDLLIKQVKYNQLVFTGNLFPLQIDVQGFGYDHKQTTVSVSHNGQTVFSSKITLTSSSYYATIPVSIEAKEAGTQHFIVTLSSLPEELSTANNRFDVFVNVIDGKQKIAFISLAPHPDISAYKQSIEQNENYSISAFSFDKISTAQLKEFSLLILHQLPGNKGEGLQLVRAANEAKLPILYVIGAQTGLTYLNAAQTDITISSNRNNTNEVMPEWQSSFALFTLSEEELAVIKKYPPLYSPYANYKINTEHDVLFTQQIGYVKTAFPLIAFGKSNGQKTGYIFGEGFWKWRMYDAALSEQKVTSSITGKIVQYLANKDDRSRFRINGNKRFAENEVIKLDGEVYNESYELVNSGDVQIVVQNAQGKNFNYTFSKTEKAYTLDMGILPIGNYRYNASTTVGSITQTIKGQFTVIPLQVEFLQTKANHQLLNELATETGGVLFFPNQFNDLEKTIRNNENIKPIVYEQETVKSLINLKWIFFLVLTLLSIEWFVRKWNGII